MDSDSPDYQSQLEEDERRVRLIRQIVDIACAGLSTGLVTPDGECELINDARRRVLEVAPDCGEQFDLIYAPRLRRIAREGRR